MTIDIRKYPGAIDALNKVLNGGREAEVKCEGNDIVVAEHIRVFEGKFSEGEERRR